MSSAYLGGHSKDIGSGGAGIRIDYRQAGSLKNGGAALNRADDRERLLKALDENVRLLKATLPPLDQHRGSFLALLAYLRSLDRFQIEKPARKDAKAEEQSVTELYFHKELVWSRDVATEKSYVEQIETILSRLERLGFDLERISLA